MGQQEDSGPGRVGDAQAGGVGAWLGAHGNRVLFRKVPAQVSARKMWNSQARGIGVPEPEGEGCTGWGGAAVQKGPPCWMPSAGRAVLSLSATRQAGWRFYSPGP